MQALMHKRNSQVESKAINFNWLIVAELEKLDKALEDWLFTRLNPY